jgi:predicted transposase YdaD
VAQNLINIGEQRGEIKGKIEGRTEERSDTIKNMIQKGKTPAEIADWCGYDLDYVNEVAESLG